MERIQILTNMRTLLLIITLTCIKAMALGQYFYGANVGVSLGKSWDGRTKEIRKGINDLYLNVPIGYAANKILFEISPQVTAGLQTSLTGAIGYKVDISDNMGIHLLAGYTDQIYWSGKPISIYHSFYPTGTFRLWLGNYSIQGSYFNKQYYVGIGVIGFWEKIN